MFARGGSEAKKEEGRQRKVGQRIEETRIERPSGKDLIFEGEQIDRIANPAGVVMALWKTRGGNMCWREQWEMIRGSKSIIQRKKPPHG